MSDRTPSTDALETLGMIHFKKESRDAIHLAVDAVTTNTELHPGQHIKIKDGIAYPASSKDSHGIVDPFLNHDVKPGQSFWFVMKPRLVRSLRHVWEHEDFPLGD